MVECVANRQGAQPRRRGKASRGVGGRQGGRVDMARCAHIVRLETPMWQTQTQPSRPDHDSCHGSSQPFSAAMCAASARESACIFWIAADNVLRTVPSDKCSSRAR